MGLFQKYNILNITCLFAAECYNGDGKYYIGKINVTRSGRSCQAWASQHPHQHNRLPEVFPTLVEAENYCRNPGGEESSPWCYTQDIGKRWEPCNIPKCGM